jgi:hypothetical protein
VELAVLDAAITVHVGAAAQPRDDLVGEDAAAIAIPLVRLIGLAGGDDRTDVGAARQRLALDEAARVDWRDVDDLGGAVGRVVWRAVARADERLGVAGVDEEVDVARRQHREDLVVEHRAREPPVEHRQRTAAAAVARAMAAEEEHHIAVVAAGAIGLEARGHLGDDGAELGERRRARDLRGFGEAALRLVVEDREQPALLGNVAEERPDRRRVVVGVTQRAEAAVGGQPGRERVVADGDHVGA